MHAVWTALGPNGSDKRDGLLTEDERVEWLKELVANGRAQAAREYFERTHAQISTPLRKRIRTELGWK